MEDGESLLRRGNLLFLVVSVVGEKGSVLESLKMLFVTTTR